ncbi:putative DNA modification/repair radical SAM protein [Desulforamulus putei DSM 12395]|uniref:Putative DNA modification/repair radical SAM protein n=1 Tax=Desulforamulus putei DSM 12395 TaxID=1121429 RepID=A0A1M4W353_9FIRM|nr:putative DNA modification/repair radical SAM protein [Desulforamulus putei DSM 12395]
MFVVELLEKLSILSAAAKYDVSCSSSGSTRKNIRGGLGNAAQSGICHSWSDDGRCISLLKILLTNYCVYDCAYCVNRVSNDIPRASFTPEEVVDLTINFYRRNYIEGLFLSSAIWKNPNHTMELLVRAVRKLRVEYRFNGYIHLKAIPGADWKLIAEAGTLVDRMSVNIELPSSEGLKLLAPQKRKENILKPMSLLGSQILENREERKRFRKAPSFVPAGQSTQLIVGATSDSDLRIIKLSENLYRSFNMKRVYYSAYVPVSSNPKLPSISTPPLDREHRLYQADWLLRFYGFEAQELLSDSHPNFQLELDPKSDWALRHLNLFPVEVNKADYHLLLRVPGIGVKSAQKIVAARRFHSLDYEDLHKIGVVLRRARYFITCRGKYYGEVPFREDVIKQRLVPKQKQEPSWTQLSLFSEQSIPVEDRQTTITGEL